MAALIVAVMALAQNNTFIMPKHFTSDINYMIPMKFNPRSVSGYTFEMIGDSVNINLPYIGEAYSAPMPSNDGMNFNCKAEKLEFGKTKKGDVTITFEARNNNGTCKFFVTAFSNNTIDIDVTPQNSSICSYRGNWEVADEDKKDKK